VVDDEEQPREIAMAILKRLGYNCFAVSSGEEALEFLKFNKVDLIVMDMLMPGGMNGLQTYREILKLYSGQKAIIVSGLSETEDVKAAQALGAGEFVHKPYSLDKIGHAIYAELRNAD